jgi:hypothetical protein
MLWERRGMAGEPYMFCGLVLEFSAGCRVVCLMLGSVSFVGAVWVHGSSSGVYCNILWESAAVGAGDMHCTPDTLCLQQSLKLSFLTLPVGVTLASGQSGAAVLCHMHM